MKLEWHDKETKIMLRIFENINYKINDQSPKLIKKNERELYTEYIFNNPLGLTDNEKLQPILEKTFGKKVEVFYKKVLYIRFYYTDLPTKIDYEYEKMKGWKAPIGKSVDGMVYHDFDKLQHMTIAGTSQWGKTSFIKMLVTLLIENHPDNVEFYVLDLKGMLSFNRYATLKQIKGVAGNYHESAKVLQVVEKDIKNTMEYFSDNYIENINETKIKKRKFIIIDEAGELVPKKTMSDADKENLKEYQRIISYIVRISAALGYRLIYGIQYPTADIMDNQIKANSSARISFRLQTSKQSSVAIDEVGAQNLGFPGRAIYKTVDRYEIQTPFINNKKMWERLRQYDNESENKQVRNDTIEIG